MYSDDTILLQQLAEGSEQAFSELYKIYQPKLSRFLHPFRHAEDPKEIIQDIFLKIWEKRDALIAVRSVEQYLYRMAKNRLLDLQKSSRARRDRESSVQQYVQEETVSAFEPAEYKELNEHAARAIDALNQRQQMIYRMRMFDDLSLDEISEKLSLSKAVVIKQLWLANKSVREHMKKYDDPGLGFNFLFFISQLFF